MFNAQGEDVVAGTHETTPLSILRERLPAVALELERYCDVLERHLADLADVEFTVEDGRLWLLQVRVGKRAPRAALRMAIDMAEQPGFPLSREQAVRRVLPLLAESPRTFRPSGDVPEALTTGLPGSPGFATGSIALSVEAAEKIASTGQTVILVRTETSPEDVRGMAKSVGVLTARGGLASHAAVVARGWGIAAVVGASEVEPADDHVAVAGRRLAEGEVITVDGSTGNVYLGRVAGRWETAPEVATLLGWAKELGIDVAGEGSEPAAPRGGAATSRDDVLVSLSIKGTTPPDKLAETLLADATRLEPVLDALVADGVLERVGADVRLTAAGKQATNSVIERDRSAAGDAGALLDLFHAFDGRMKELVTAWQMREVEGEQTLNDHDDAAYDASVLRNLTELHQDAAAWLLPIASKIRRYAAYRTRLDRALSAAQSGDQRFVASPRVDSYHSVWFELHEDLIRLAGRTRSE
jgi:pyruvate,orthophosphate dikinase